MDSPDACRSLSPRVLTSTPAMSATEWDDFVADIKNGHIFQTMRWAMCKQMTGWQPCLLSLLDQGSPRAVCLALHRSMARLSIGGVLYVARGPVLDYEQPQAPHLLSEMLDGLMRLARRRFAVVRISPDVEQQATWVGELLLEKGFRRATHPIGHTITIRLNLTQPLGQIIGGMQSQRRRKIQQYERDKSNWSGYCDNSSQCFETFYRMYHQTLLCAGKHPKCIEELRRMHEKLVCFGSSAIFIIEHRNCPVAGGMAVALGERIWYLYSGSLRGDDGVSGAGMYLQWEMTKWAKDQGYAEFDLGGIPDAPDPDDPLYGVYCFKRRWGGDEVRLIGEFDYAPYPFTKDFLEWKLSH